MIQAIEAAAKHPDPSEPAEAQDEKPKAPRYVQWDYKGGVYTPMPSLNLRKKLAPGYYYPFKDQFGQTHLEQIDVRLDGLVDFGKGVSKRVTDEIDLFWKAEPRFREINKTVKVLYKRGILMYGPPGCGKSSLIAVIMRDIVAQGGIALHFVGSSFTTDVVKTIREIQPDTKILIVMEDIDGHISQRGEEDLLNMLDGVDTVLDRLIFLATSNYFSRLSPRLLRPSRFDLKIELDYPDADLRKRYLQDLLKANGVKSPIDLKRSVDDTEGFSFADLKELFISTCIFGYEYGGCVEDLRNALHTEESEGERKSDAVEKLTYEMSRLSTALVGKQKNQKKLAAIRATAGKGR